MSEKLEREIESYRRILDRERQAKKLAEIQLETYSREIFQSNELLKEQTKQAQIKQRHLAFLTSVAEDNLQSESVEDLLGSYLKKSSNFIETSLVAYFQIENNDSITHLQFAKKDELEYQVAKKISPVQAKTLLEQLDLVTLKSDYINHGRGALFSIADYSNEKEYKQSQIKVYLLPIFTTKASVQDNLNCICFFYKNYDDVDLLKLQTIEATHSILSVAIERKNADSALHHKVLELQHSNENLQQIQQQLVESEKLASLGELSAGIAHEINNPVGFVLSNLSTMTEYLDELKLAIAPLDDATLSPEQALIQLKALAAEYETDFLFDDTKAILTSSIKGLGRVKDIVSDLRSFSRMDSDELADVDLSHAIKSALNIIQNELKYQHTVEMNLTPDLHILGNDGQLQQVFINLFINAKHAMPEGGILSIKSEKIRERVVVTISDQGHGIEPEALNNIFTPFFTTKPPGEGTGLGLSISYSILQRHHAKIKVDSIVGEGTTFTLSFVPNQ